MIFEIKAKIHPGSKHTGCVGVILRMPDKSATSMWHYLGHKQQMNAATFDGDEKSKQIGGRE
jgi:hypothetical protein